MGRRLEYEVKTSVRLNMSNPQHVKINDVIQNLDPKIFKSKNQFIIDAIQFYIDNYGKETFVIKKKEKERAEYIRSEDIDDIKEEVIEAATNEAKAAFENAPIKPFKCDVTGNDKNYGFNVVNVNSTELVVFEAAIDLMSYVDIFTDYESNKLALGMLADAPLETFLREHPQITSIRFCLDGDEPGRKAAAELMRKYYELGYEVEDCPPPAGYKDYNEWLVAAKLNLNRMNKRADEPVRA